MLQAIIRQRGRRRRDWRRDEVTALVFGGLAYLPATEAWPVFRDLLLAGGAGADPAGFAAASWRLEFWPRQGPYAGHDLAALFRDSAGTETAMLVDVLWQRGARLATGRPPPPAAPAGGAVRCWRLALGDRAPRLPPQPAGGRAGLGWASVADALARGRREWPRGAALWAADVVNLLACLDVRPFSGFAHLRPRTTLRGGHTVFWHAFAGFGGLAGRYPLAPRAEGTVFFHPTSHRGNRTLH